MLTLEMLQKMANQVTNGGAEITALDEPLDDQGIDSLDKASLFLEIEKETGVEIPDEKFEELVTPAHVIAFVESSKG